MTRYRRIEQQLKQALTPEYLELVNESHRHSVPPDSETHFKLTIVSEAFNGLTRIQRHQAIYRCLENELATGLHALSMTAQTPAEWQQSPLVPKSPPCRGGSLT